MPRPKRGTLVRVKPRVHTKPEHGELWVCFKRPPETSMLAHYTSLATGFKWVWFDHEVETVDGD